MRTDWSRWMVRGTGIAFFASLLVLQGCSPKVGSEAWCKKMKETPKGDWTANEAADFAKHCLLK